MHLTASLLTAVSSIGYVSAVGVSSRESCDTDKLDSATFFYPITVDGTTVFDVAKATKRGVCDIGRENLMADVEIIPNVGQSIRIPPQVCEPDNETCLLSGPGTRNCVLGGPRLYYTQRGDTYAKIAGRLNMTVSSLTSGNETSATEQLPVGQFVKVPLCDPSECVIQPFQMSSKVVYKDLADRYGSTVGQIISLSPTYNYSNGANAASPDPSISIPVNCTLLDSDYDVLG
ncbi:LysM domain [Geosmithia morbida]|uniref:LysM domain n=1 Tax=Geosmithia morbida TaxID=1094350 RepID=A0A9P5CZE8_9HYPO|nr:LysM domain [Geosmithia morbida]KAF4121503.1 LysM domain [Geosmithia morbida]